jgi:hypothetical protein
MQAETPGEGVALTSSPPWLSSPLVARKGQRFLQRSPLHQASMRRLGGVLLLAALVHHSLTSQAIGRCPALLFFFYRINIQKMQNKRTLGKPGKDAWGIRAVLPLT